MLLARCIPFLVAAAQLWAAPPEVTKVEPPNWWIGHSINPVRLLIRGRNLEGARAAADWSGSDSGLDARERRGHVRICGCIHRRRTRSPARIRCAWQRREERLLRPSKCCEPLPRAGRFQGFSPDDVIYLIMPDRFANGDPSNDDPAVSRGLFDRQKPRYYHGGDFQGIIDHLPYLKDLGVTASGSTRFMTTSTA